MLPQYLIVVLDCIFHITDLVEYFNIFFTACYRIFEFLLIFLLGSLCTVKFRGVLYIFWLFFGYMKDIVVGFLLLDFECFLFGIIV